MILYQLLLGDSGEFCAQWQGMVDAVCPRPPVFFLGVWILYILTSPFYVFGQGAPQPADYLILVFGFPALAFAALMHRGKIPAAILCGILFAALTVFVNLAHYAFHADPRFLYAALYYPFNLCVFLLVVKLFFKAPVSMRRATYAALATSLIFQLIYAVFFGPNEMGRALGTFNNPNQLSYWALLALTMLVVLKRAAPFTFMDFALFATALALQALALSKAGLIVTAGMMVYIALLPNIRLGGRLMVAFLVMATGAVILFAPLRGFQTAQDVAPLASITERLASIGAEYHDNPAGRGYGRLADYPHYLILGAGEGGYNRFEGSGQELHSGLATMVFSYGLVGLGLFAVFLFSVFYPLPRRYAVLLGLILLFGVAHQNLRFSHFWMFLGICYAGTLYGAHHQRGVGAAKAE